MSSKMKSFRASENTQFMLKHYSEYIGVSESKLIEMALDWFYKSGMCNVVADMKHMDKYESWPELADSSSKSGDVRVIVRRENGLGVAPITYM